MACHQCKLNLTSYLDLKMLALSPCMMTNSDQKLATAGPTDPMSSTMSGSMKMRRNIK